MGQCDIALTDRAGLVYMDSDPDSRTETLAISRVNPPAPIPGLHRQGAAAIYEHHADCCRTDERSARARQRGA
jgi:hypothetical protein